MDKLKKIGLSALATSLVASSAYGADVSVVGNTGFTYSSQNGNTGTPDTDHGKGIGTDNSMTFSHSGELDNGWSVSASTALTDAFALTSSSVTLTMGDFGSIKSGSGFGGNSASYDEETPRAYEQVDDGGGTTSSMNLVGSKNDNGSLAYTSPSIDLMGASATIHVGYTPKAEDAFVAGGATTGVSTMGSGQDLGITLSHDSGLKFGIYGAERSREQNNAKLNDAFEGTWYATYSMGPISVGYQESYADSGTSPSQTNAAATATFDSSSGYFEANQIAIAFNVNDDLSVSYQKLEDTYDAQAGAAGGATTGGAAVADVTVDTKSISAAYSMGSMSIKAYRTSTDNVGYSTNGGSVTVNEIALGLSF
jgi:outer membrane protein OmpU